MASRISEKTISEITERISIVDVISPCVPLNKAGKNYKGVCPFHPDKNPSFVVNPERNTFHCFGCGVGGDVYSFFMKFHNVPFLDAVRELARQAGVRLAERPEKKDPEKEEAYRKAVSLNRFVCQFYHKTLMEKPAGRTAREYLKKRGVSMDRIAQFTLGYAPNSWDGLLHALSPQKDTLASAVSLGLLIQKKTGRGYYDRFRNRIMFPILGSTGQVLAFGGRSLDEQGPKYINSPESNLYHKGSVLYGLNLAQQFIRDHDSVILVEGYLDLIALHQHGFSHSVAVLGTALTAQQIQILKRYTRNFILVFDGDPAGKKASFRNLPEFLQREIPTRVVYLPENEDPDSFLRKQGVASFQTLLDRAFPLLDTFLKEKTNSLDSVDPVEKKVSVLRELIPVIRKIPDRLEQNLRLKVLAEEVGIEELFLRDELSKSKEEKREKRDDLSVVRERETRVWPVEERLVCQILIQFPYLIPKFMETNVLESFTSSTLKKIIRTFGQYFLQEGTLDLPKVLSTQEDPDLSFLLTSLSCKEEFTQKEAVIALGDSLRRIQKKSLQTRLKTLNKKIQEAENTCQADLQSRLFQEKQRLLQEEETLLQ